MTKILLLKCLCKCPGETPNGIIKHVAESYGKRGCKPPGGVGSTTPFVFRQYSKLSISISSFAVGCAYALNYTVRRFAGTLPLQFTIPPRSNQFPTNISYHNTPLRCCKYIPRVLQLSRHAQGSDGYNPISVL